MGKTRSISVRPVLLLGWILSISDVAGETEESTMSDAEKQQKIETLYVKYERKFPTVEGITATELMQSLEKGDEYILVDVRKPKEQEVSMIPGAITQQVRGTAWQNSGYVLHGRVSQRSLRQEDPDQGLAGTQSGRKSVGLDSRRGASGEQPGRDKTSPRLQR